MDLAKIGETRVFCSEGIVNQRLAEGWVILSVKIVNNRGRSYTLWVIGKPRESRSKLAVVSLGLAQLAARVSAVTGKPFPVEARLEEGTEWLRTHLDIENPDHPDFHAHAKSVT